MSAISTFLGQILQLPFGSVMLSEVGTDSEPL